MTVFSIDLDIVAMGLVTSVGHDVVTACEAIRAGISRPAPLYGTGTLELETLMVTPLIGHPLTPIADGFLGSARWMQMIPHAIRDALKGLSWTDALWAQTEVSLLVPDLEGERFAYDERSPTREAQMALRRSASRVLEHRVPLDRIHLIAEGRTGLARVLSGLRSRMEERCLRRALLVAADSLVDPLALQYLMESERLKSDENPVGLMPGEAAAAIVCELPTARVERAPPIARITRGALSDTAVEDVSSPERGLRYGRTLAPLITEDTGDLYTDLNGETWRAREHGLGCLKWGKEANERMVLHHPAAEIGDVGAASSVVSVILAAYGMLERAIAARSCAVVSSEWRGRVSGIQIGT